jgi:molybdopterin-guanine dinucleotide biosynthesis protein A
MPPPFSAAVLAGGASRRYGRDKATAPYHGRPLAVRVLASLAAAEERFLVAPRPYPQLGAPTIPDRIVGAGPLAGVHAALRHARYDWVAVAACDLPGLTPALWQLLLTRAWGCDAVAFIDDNGRLEPLAALYHRRLLPAVDTALAAGERAPHRVLRSAHTRLLPARSARVVAGVRALVNLNRPGDAGRPNRRPKRPPSRRRV